MSVRQSAYHNQIEKCRSLITSDGARAFLDLLLARVEERKEELAQGDIEVLALRNLIEEVQREEREQEQKDGGYHG